MFLAPLLCLVLFAGTAFSQNSTEGGAIFKKQLGSGGGGERSRLYTKPDPASPGGLKGRITHPDLPVEQILAVPDTNPEEVYQGELAGPKRDTFQFTGLPAGKYDLLVIYDSSFYEGCQLDSAPSTLSPEDLKKIEASIQKSEPFFTKKVIHRIGGQTGRSSFARSICTYIRDTLDGNVLNPDTFRRTYKLVVLKDVGPGWQIVRARDLYPVSVNPKHPLPSHHYSAVLNQIRVADQIKDLGDIDLSR